MANTGHDPRFDARLRRERASIEVIGSPMPTEPTAPRPVDPLETAMHPNCPADTAAALALIEIAKSLRLLAGVRPL